MRDKNGILNLCSQVRMLAALLVLLLDSATARAEDFKTHYDLALALYQAQKFDDAIPEFKAAYALTPKSGLLFNIAQAYRKAGHPREAIEYYDRYLSETPQIDGDTRHKVDVYLAEARNTLAALELEMKRRLAEDKAAHEPEPQPIALPPTGVPLPATGSGTSLGPAPVVAVTSDQPSAGPPLYKRWWLWTALGGAVVAGVVIGVALGTPHPATPVVVASDVPRGTLTF